MQVTESSVRDNWIRGVVRLPPHTYPSPNNQGKPWTAQYTGCCRFTDLLNNAGDPYALSADVDLTRSSRSATSAVPPVVTVPYNPVSMPRPTLYVAADDSASIDWSLGKPAIVGGAVHVGALNTTGSLSVPLAPIAAMHTAGAYCANTSSSGACLYALLAQDSSVAGLTVEGWVRIADDEGGYVLSTGEDVRGSCPFTGAERVRRCEMSVLSIRVNSTTVTVGHEVDEAADPYFSAAHTTFDVCSSSAEVCEVLRAYDAGMSGSMTRKWVHLAVVRTPAPAGGAACAGGAARLQYTVYLNGVLLGVSEGMCGAMNRVGLASHGALLFGAYRPEGNSSAYTEATLAEWRFWHGVRSPSQITGSMLARIRPAADGEAPTEGVVTVATHTSSNVLMALWDFTVACEGEEACTVSRVDPLYPTGGPFRALLGAAATEAVVTAETDSSGVMFWESAVGAMEGVDPNGRVTLLPKKGPGLYQVTVYISRGGTSGRVPVDFMVHVVHVEPDAEGLNTLCPGGLMGCAFAGNQFMPTLRVMGDVLMAGECSAVYRPGPALSSDLGGVLYPCSVAAYTGFQVRLTALGEDAQRALGPGGAPGDGPDGDSTLVGFAAGRAPEGMRFRALRAMTPAQLEVTWTPCGGEADRTVCLEARDYHLNGSAVLPSVSSPAACVRFVVREDPPPFFVAGLSQTATAVFTIGRMGRFALHAADDNCADEVGIAVAAGSEPLPVDAVLSGGVRHPPAVGREGCVATTSEVTWAPSYKHGGYRKTLCFEARDRPDGCAAGGTGHAVQHCVEVAVRRCVYAVQSQQQLQHVAGIYGLDWMRVWSVNPQVLHPDYLPYSEEGREVMVGHLMSMDSRRETAGSLAQRMGMGLDQLLDLNFGLDMEAPLALGQEVCVVPNSCRGMAKTIQGTIEYQDPGSVAEGVADGTFLPAPGAPEMPGAK